MFHNIIGAHYNDMITQDGCKKVAFGRTETKFITLFNTKKICHSYQNDPES